MLSKWKQKRKIWLESRWRKGFIKKYLKCMNCGNNDKIRLILGPGRSGTSWLSRVLAKSGTRLRFFNEPLFHIQPKLPFSNKFDHTALPYCPAIDSTHPLAMAYAGLALPHIDWAHHLPDGILLRDDKDFSVCLIKEVHSLLATEALLKYLQSPCLVITRNPVYVIDSLLAVSGVGAPVYKNEACYINDKVFLNRYLPGAASRIQGYLDANDVQSKDIMQVAISKALTVGVMNRMLEIIAEESPCVLHIRYEHLCETPFEIFSRASRFLSLDFDLEMQKFLSETQSVKESEKSPYSVFRDTTRQLNRPMKVLSETQRDEILNILADCGLLYE